MDSYLCFILVQWNYRWCEKILKHGSLTIDKLFVTETKENISGEKQKIQNNISRGERPECYEVSFHIVEKLKEKNWKPLHFHLIIIC